MSKRKSVHQPIQWTDESREIQELGKPCFDPHGKPVPFHHIASLPSAESSNQCHGGASFQANCQLHIGWSQWHLQCSEWWFCWRWKFARLHGQTAFLNGATGKGRDLLCVEFGSRLKLGIGWLANEPQTGSCDTYPGCLEVVPCGKELWCHISTAVGMDRRQSHHRDHFAIHSSLLRSALGRNSTHSRSYQVVVERFDDWSGSFCSCSKKSRFQSDCATLYRQACSCQGQGGPDAAGFCGRRRKEDPEFPHPECSEQSLKTISSVEAFCAWVAQGWKSCE